MHVQVPFIESLLSALSMVIAQIIAYYLSKHIIIPRYFERQLSKFVATQICVILILTIIILWTKHLFIDYSFLIEDIKIHFIRVFIFTIILLVITVWTSTSVYILEREQETLRQLQFLEAEKTLSELKFLKAQINPHFLFNALNNIYSMSYMEDKTTPEKIAMLSEMLRYVLYDCNSEFVALEKEIIYLENYIEFQKLRTENAQQIELNTKILDSKTSIAPMIIIPFVENAFKHSRINKFPNAYVNIFINQDIESIELTIVNTIPKVRFVSEASSSGVGIENIKNRLSLIYKQNAKLEIIEDTCLYSVRLKIKI
jgi:LytS/YehU family sensor histidine kinase